MTMPVPQPRIMVMTTVPQTLTAFLVPQLRSLEEAGFEVHVVSSPGPALDTLGVGPDTTRHGIPLERRPDPVRDLASLWRMFQLIRRVRPQIVHAHTPKAGLIGMAAAALAGVPVRLYTIHGLPLLTRSGIRRWMLEAAERTSASLATHCYAVSESVRSLLVELKLCPAAKVAILGDGSCAGVDVDCFFPSPGDSRVGQAVRSQYGIPAEAPLVTFVGRLARDKGIGVLGQAWPEVAAASPGAYLLLVGEKDTSDPVPDEEMAALQRHPRVRFAGTVGKPQVFGVYTATDIGVLPTFREGLPQTALEAAAAGLPMVATRVSGVVNAIEDGVTGLLVPAGQAAPLASALRLLLSDVDLRRRLGAAARARVVNRFSQQRVNQLWMSEYHRLVQALLPDCAERPETPPRMQAGRSDAY